MLPWLPGEVEGSSEAHLGLESLALLEQHLQGLMLSHPLELTVLQP